MAFHYSPKIVTDGLVLYLDAANTKSYVSGSTTWNDISRGNYSASILNNPIYSQNNSGIFIFDGTNQNITGATSTNLSFGTNNFSINYWFYINSFNVPSPTIIDLRTISNDFGYADFISSATTTFRLYWNNSTQYTSTKQIFVGNWYNILVTRSGTTLSVYINGLLDGTKTDSSNLTSGQLKIGRNVNTVGTSYFNGRVQSLIVYNKALTSNEVLQNYNATKTRFGL